MKYKHYSPHANVIIMNHLDSEELRVRFDAGEKIAILATRKRVKEYFKNGPYHYKGDMRIMERGNKDNLIQCASKLYDFFHLADQLERDTLYVEQLPEVGL